MIRQSISYCISLRVVMRISYSRSEDTQISVPQIQYFTYCYLAVHLQRNIKTQRSQQGATSPVLAHLCWCLARAPGAPHRPSATFTLTCSCAFRRRVHCFFRVRRSGKHIIFHSILSLSSGPEICQLLFHRSMREFALSWSGLRAKQSFCTFRPYSQVAHERL